MYRLHGVADWGSQVVHLALAELAVPFTFQALDRDAGDFARPEFLALNPFAQVPVLETPDGPIFETAAILLYLTEKHGILAPPPGSADRAAFLIWFVLVTNTVHPLAMTTLHPERPGGEASAAAVAEITEAKMRQALAELDRVAAGGAWWLSGDRPSITSLYLAMLMRWIKAFPVYSRHAVPSQDFPALHAMLKGLESRAAIRAVLDAEGLRGPAFSNPPCETVDDAA